MRMLKFVTPVLGLLSHVDCLFFLLTILMPQLVSSKYLTCFSDFRPTPDEPQFMKATRYLQYLEDYVERFDLRQFIYLSTRVVSVRRRDKGHVIRYNSPQHGEEEWECDAVAVCSGLHVTPEIPKIPGMERVPSVLHSAQFKGRKDFGNDKTVVVLGAGETAMDIAHMAVTTPATRRVVLCHKNGWVNAPKVFPRNDGIKCYWDFLTAFSSSPRQTSSPTLAASHQNATSTKTRLVFRST